MPRNSLLNGKAAPDTGGLQLDETSYPILMAYLSGLGGDTTLYQDHIRPAADFLVANGPSDGVERWEEQTGYSPSTIAAEIAGLTAASAIAASHGDTARAHLYQATADDFQRNIKNWTVTTTGPDGPAYFIRLSKTGDPNAAISYSLGNGGPTVDQRSVLDGGFQELVRLGELPVSEPDVQASLAIFDKNISVSTPSGTGYYRYGNSAAQGSADGYGDCYQPSQDSCTVPGAPWPPTDTGTGHLWPVLSGERAESDLTRFQVLSDGTYAYLRVTLRTLVPTFGAIDGAQLLDVYVHVPGASSTSTQAAYASRNYTIAPSGAWSQRVEVQGFASPVWVNAAGNSVGTASALAVQADQTITVALPEAQFGTPTSGWGFSVVLTGQDGFSPDLARAFTATPGAYTFGVCAAGNTAPICSVGPSTVPKAMDVITPPGVSQATELDPTLGPVVIQPVTVP